MLIYGGDGLWREQRRWVRTSRKIKPALDISLRFFRIQRYKPGAKGDSLLKLPQGRGVKFVVQFGLPDQKNL